MVLALQLIAGPRPARAAFDEFDDAHAPSNFAIHSAAATLILKGELELELHDLEGRGGTAYDSATDTPTIGTRSPFVEIDTFALAPRLELADGVAVNSVLAFGQRSAAVTAVWLDLRGEGPARLLHQLEAGIQTPFVAVDRRSERYPLIATAYWREPEVHLAGESLLLLGPRTHAEVGLSLAMMRPFGRANVQESTSQPSSIALVAYGPATPMATAAPVLGGKLAFTSHGAAVTGFGFVGRLGRERGTDALRSAFPNYAILPGYAETDQIRDDTFFWYGGRFACDRYGLHLLAETISSRESFLRRYGAYAQLSLELPLRPTSAWFHTLELLGRHEIYRLRGAKRPRASGLALRSPAVQRAVTWDFNVTTVGATGVLYQTLLRLRLELYRIGETNGVPGLDIADQPFANDELLLQLELRF